jgi:hypothetical protein
MRNEVRTFLHEAILPMLKKILPAFVLLAIGIQLLRPAKNVSTEPIGPNHIAMVHPAPADVRNILEAACYDCHSNNTRYPWYADIQPFAWWLADHVRDGKKALNFSEFGRLTPRRARARLEACVDEVSEKRMPLKSYRLGHPDARLTDGQIKAFVAWAEEAAASVEDAPGKK